MHCSFLASLGSRLHSLPELTTFLRVTPSSSLTSTTEVKAAEVMTRAINTPNSLSSPSSGYSTQAMHPLPSYSLSSLQTLPHKETKEAKVYDFKSLSLTSTSSSSSSSSSSSLQLISSPHTNNTTVEVKNISFEPPASPCLAPVLPCVLSNSSKLFIWGKQPKGDNYEEQDVENLRNRLTALSPSNEIPPGISFIRDGSKMVLESTYSFDALKELFPDFFYIKQTNPRHPEWAVALYAPEVDPSCSFRSADSADWAQLTPQYQRQLLQAIPDLEKLKEYHTILSTSARPGYGEKTAEWKWEAAMTGLILYFTFHGRKDNLADDIYHELMRKWKQVEYIPLIPEYMSSLDILPLYLTELSMADLVYFNSRCSRLELDYAHDSKCEQAKVYQQALDIVSEKHFYGHGFRPDMGGLANLTKVALEYDLSTLRTGSMDWHDYQDAGYHGPFFVTLSGNNTPYFFMLPEAKDKEIVSKIFDIAHAKGGLSVEEWTNLKARLITTQELVSFSEEAREAFFAACRVPIMKAWKQI